MNASSSISTALIVMTRWPATTRCKKRLSNDIGPYKASLIQGKLINHTLEVVKEINELESATIHLAVSGVYEQAMKRLSQKNGIKNISSQGNGNLGIRMRRTLLRIQNRNKYQKIIIIGTDLPTICRRNLVEAIEALNKHSLVLGPSKDGGYWLIGLSRELIKPVTIWPFVNIPWGTDKVLETTLKFARFTDTNYFLLEEQNDLDHLEDLSPWFK